jgi:DNA gyrase/topoisomerase IV subunit A
VLRSDLAVARDGLRAATERRTALLAEQEGASLGVLATDNATDRSISQQTTDRLTPTLVEVDAMLAERRARRAAIQQQLDAERQRVGLLREAPLRAPIVWS